MRLYMCAQAKKNYVIDTIHLELKDGSIMHVDADIKEYKKPMSKGINLCMKRVRFSNKYADGKLYTIKNNIKKMSVSVKEDFILDKSESVINTSDFSNIKIWFTDKQDEWLVPNDIVILS